MLEINQVLLDKQLQSYWMAMTKKPACRKMPPEYMKMIRPDEWDGVCHVYLGECPTCLCGTTNRS